jgi:ATP-dependent helicase/nuclease subunit A
VGAAAGTGKTKILTDRLLRLLLQECAPEKILCLTFTKAAATEMNERLHHQLEKWATSSPPLVHESLIQLTGTPPSPQEVEKARGLFHQVLGSSLKIQTLHSFCQALLRRFPLEAGVSPHFPVMDELQATEIYHQAVRQVYEQTQAHPSSLLAQALNHLLSLGEPTSLHKVLSHPHCRSFWEQSPHLAEDNFSSLIQLVAQILNLDRKSLDLDPQAYGLSAQEAELQCVLSPHRDEEGLASLARIFSLQKEEAFREKESLLLQWITGDGPTRLGLKPAYDSLFLRQDGLPLKALLPAALRKAYPEALEVMEREAHRLSQEKATQSACHVGRATLSLLVVAQAVQKAYGQLKEQALDYDDLILLSRQLLEKAEAREWVKYKLDGGLDHILIDEAQDTSLSQWQIIKALCEEFFVGEGARDPLLLPRSLFVVGDYKQSIYSFQGAEPEIFSQMGPYFSSQATQSSQAWRDVNLHISFRSLPPILKMVDQVFADPSLTAGVLPKGETLTSQAFRQGSGGVVEVWPLVPGETPPPLDPWELPRSSQEKPSKENRLAQLMADRIFQWIQEERLLTHKNRPVAPGDILILVRRRGSFVASLVRELKKRHIPVAGMDRIFLTQQLAVRDLLALGQCLLLPQDDLTLATVLKSPLIGLSEDHLFSLAYDRGLTSLWDRLLHPPHPHPAFSQAREKLLQWQKLHAQCLSPHDFFYSILLQERKEIVRRLGPESQEVLDEFLEVALSYEQVHQLSLSHFLNWMGRQALEVKRDLSSLNQVRIMTVHGAKGLQAPIVFLADTVTSPTLMKEPLSSLPFHLLEELWGEVSEERPPEDSFPAASPFSFQGKIPLYSPGGWEDHLPMGPLRERQKLKALEEYHRLLYVALTRAEDELYITGWEGAHAPSPVCWYKLCQNAISRLGQPTDFPSLKNAEGLPLQGWRFHI